MLRGAGLGLGGVAGAALFGCGEDGASKVDLADDGRPPEVSRIRMAAFDTSSLCLAPIVLAPDFFPEEGLIAELLSFPETAELSKAVGDGKLDFAQDFASATIAGAASGHKVTFLAGLHSGCTEVFVREGINSAADLAGKKIGVPFGDTTASSSYAFLLTFMSFIGVPVDRSVKSYDADKLPGLLLNGQLDAVVGVAPYSDNLRGVPGIRVILSTTDDRPWSDYYCCTLFANTEFVKKNPIATKRVLRTVLKATDLIAQQPEQAARRLVELGSFLDYDATLKFIKHLPYGLWRSVNPEDSLRFYALRLKEVGAIKKTPDQVIARTDWRFLNQLKREVAYAPGNPQRRSAFALDCAIQTPEGPVAS
jgi:NitT/TauT family transport system substrate-binding protein